MTTTGHVITGAAIGIICMPQSYTNKRALSHLLIFSLMATIPDWGLPSWGHERYYFSHSIYVNSLIIGIVSLIIILIPITRRLIVGNKLLYPCAVIAWLSHFLLDSFYNHGYGIAIFWPFSKSRLVLPIPWLSVYDGSLQQLTSAGIRVFILEVVTFLPLIVLALLVRKGLLSLQRNRVSS
jgi:hypothetical protein